MSSNRARESGVGRNAGVPRQVGLALGGGAARGWAHIGVLRALDRLGIDPAVIAGTSIGALVGAAYVCGNLDALADWVRRLRWDYFLRYGDIRFAGGGVVSGSRLLKALSPFISNEPIEGLPKRFGCVATDLDTGREVWFRDGPTLQAVRASISIPGVFSPIRHEQRWLVDGGLVNPVPVSLCRAMGGHPVIAVNLNGDLLGHQKPDAPETERRQHPSRPKEVRQEAAGLAMQVRDHVPAFVRPLFEQGGGGGLLRSIVGPGQRSPSLLDVAMGAVNIMQDRITRSRMAGDPAEVVLTPRLGHVRLLDFDRAEEAIAEGEAVVERMRPAIEDALSL